jgi:steroid 5-alpha reductase family enzyme
MLPSVRNPLLEPVTHWITSSLHSGPCGVLALTALSSLVCLPLTQYKSCYGITVGYGLSVATMALVMRHAFLPLGNRIGSVLTLAALFYGLRLAVFLWIRDVSRALPVSSTAEPGRLQRIPWAISLALFYAFLMTPVLYSLRHPISVATASWRFFTAWTGGGLAWLGVLMEAVADAHKWRVKRHSHRPLAFRGPSRGLYAITRHPNYTGEVVFWLGLWCTGVPSFQGSVVAWLCSSAGLYGILRIMWGATQSLEQSQEEKYGGQPKYEAWKKKVRAPLIPFWYG